MQIMVVVIEKDGDKFSAYCPNLLGVSVVAANLEDAEKAILTAVEKRVSELSDSYSLNTSISATDPIEELIPCVAKTTNGWSSRSKCLQAAKKDGLCWQHWKKAFGHAFGTKINLRACPLCGESDREILQKWDSLCSFKAENPTWPNVWEKMKLENRVAWKQEAKELELEKLGEKIRCSQILSGGEKCTKEAYRGSLCHSHAYRTSDRFSSNRESNYDPNENSRNYFKYRNLR